MKSRRGFTIVELLIVIVVIAILAAIVTVVYGGMKARATNSSNQQSLLTVEKALKLYKADTGKPLYVEDQYLTKEDPPGQTRFSLSGNQYYLGGNGMVGVCPTRNWPSTYGTDYNAACGVGGTYHSYYHEAMTDMLRAVPTGSAFPDMPTMNPVSVAAVRSSGEVDNYTIRGIRYAFNGSLTNPIGYLYYAVEGKQCFTGDASLRVQSTVNIGIGPGGSFSGFSETGGDYTANNTQHCVRTFAW